MNEEKLVNNNKKEYLRFLEVEIVIQEGIIKYIANEYFTKVNITDKEEIELRNRYIKYRSAADNLYYAKELALKIL